MEQPEAKKTLPFYFIEDEIVGLGFQKYLESNQVSLQTLCCQHFLQTFVFVLILGAEEKHLKMEKTGAFGSEK